MSNDADMVRVAQAILKTERPLSTEFRQQVADMLRSYKEGYEAGRAAIDRWRSISEAPEDEEVLIFVPPDWVSTGYYQPDGKGGGEWRWSVESAMHPNHSPTHWMPLPEPPQE